MADRKECFALVSAFEKRAKKAGSTQIINRYSARWAAEDLLESMSRAEIDVAMDYYFKINDTPNWQTFVKNADRLYRAAMDHEQDMRERAVRRQQLKEIMNEFGR